MHCLPFRSEERYASSATVTLVAGISSKSICFRALVLVEVVGGSSTAPKVEAVEDRETGARCCCVAIRFFFARSSYFVVLPAACCVLCSSLASKKLFRTEVTLFTDA